MKPETSEKPEREAEVVDLRRHRKAAEARAAEAKAAAQRAARARAAASRQGILGGRRHAGLILLAVALGLLALFVLPRLL
ncbi:MAG: hypothetical protein ACK41C_09820 [Phenylobacterium sp.]|uniref:hypothetical protein n=1 Tax=Phenylobacterium sp. TaxID=1871053 RepID=UPI00391C3026